ncbi:MAG: hypothetical protein ABR561_06380 [Guyparkeria sp.]
MPSIGRRLAAVSLLIGAVLLSACGPHYPLGIPEDQWTRMSPSEQNEARLKQAEVDRAQAEARRREADARQAEAAARAAELEHARSNAAPGERVQCVLQPVEMRFGDKWRPAEPIGLDLVTGMTIDFVLRARESRYRTIEGQATFNGMEVRLCPRHGDDCARLLATSGELRRGVTRAVIAEDRLRGQLHCELAHPSYRHRY